MSANLIGVMVAAPVDPVKFTDEQVEQLRVRNLRLLEPVLKYRDTGELPEGHTEESIKSLSEEAEKAFDFRLDFLCEEVSIPEADGAEVEIETAKIDRILELYRDPAKFLSVVRELEQQYNEELLKADDVAYREFVIDGVRSRVIFAGEMTWGDDPDGVGFKLLRKILDYGLGDLFMLR